YGSGGGEPPNCGGVDPGFYAQYLANTINVDNPYVTARWNGNYGNGAAIILTAKTTGANTDYSLSAGSPQYMQYHQEFSGDTLPDFDQPSYFPNPSGATL